LFHSKQVDQERVLASLALDFSGLGVSTGNRSRKVTIGWDHDEGDISLRSTSNHVLDERSVARRINDGVMLGLGKELLGRAGDGHSTLTLLLLAIHVEGKGKRSLSKSVGLISELLHLTLRNSSQFEDQPSGRRGFTSIDVPTNNNTDVLLALGHVVNLSSVSRVT
jgi:hypothetical protein